MAKDYVFALITPSGEPPENKRIRAIMPEPNEGLPIKLVGRESSGCCCRQGCSLDPIDGKCELEFVYVNVNAVQDDAFDIFLLNASGVWVLAGNIDGKCESLASPPCYCSKVDTKSFKFTIDQSFVSNKAECAIEFKSVLTNNNECGTFGTFDIVGPQGTGFGGFLGGAGLIDISVACFPSGERPD